MPRGDHLGGHLAAENHATPPGRRRRKGAVDRGRSCSVAGQRPQPERAIDENGRPRFMHHGRRRDRGLRTLRQRRRSGGRIDDKVFGVGGAARRRRSRFAAHRRGRPSRPPQRASAVRWTDRARRSSQDDGDARARSTRTSAPSQPANRAHCGDRGGGIATGRAPAEAAVATFPVIAEHCRHPTGWRARRFPPGRAPCPSAGDHAGRARAAAGKTGRPGEDEVPGDQLTATFP